MNDKTFELTDEQLCLNYVNGNRLAFEMLINRWEKQVFGLVYRSIRDKESAEDLTQDIFIKVFKSMRYFRGESSFKTWVYRITLNTIIDYQRKEKKSKNRVDLKYLDGNLQLRSNERNAEERLSDEGKTNAIRSAISKLPQGQRAILLLKEYSGLTFEEIGRVLSCPESTVKSRLYKSLKNMKSFLEEEYPGGL